MSKFDRHKKEEEQYIYPHKHCAKCGDMIEEAYTYCSNCYKEMEEKKAKKPRFKWFKRIKKESKE